MEIPEKHKTTVFLVALLAAIIMFGGWFAWQPIAKAEEPPEEIPEIKMPYTFDEVPEGQWGLANLGWGQFAQTLIREVDEVHYIGSQKTTRRETLIYYNETVRETVVMDIFCWFEKGNGREHYIQIRYTDTASDEICDKRVEYEAIGGLIHKDTGRNYALDREEHAEKPQIYSEEMVKVIEMMIEHAKQEEIKKGQEGV